jgi:hypothetical protein
MVIPNIKKSWIFLTPITISLIMISTILFLSKTLPSKIPLFYSLSWGEKQLANHQQLLIIPGSIILITLFNLIISWQLHSQQTFLKKILLISALLVSLILTISFVKIVFIFI